MPWSPLGAGYLTGTIDAKTVFGKRDFRSFSPRFTPDAIDANQVIVELVRKIATEKHATPAQVALAWLLARAPFVVPIFGTRTLARVTENLGATDVMLTTADMAAIEATLASITIEGARLPEAVLKLSYV